MDKIRKALILALTSAALLSHGSTFEHTWTREGSAVFRSAKGKWGAIISCSAEKS